VILAPAVADVLNIFFPGAGIPVVMGILGLITLWAGIASWRRNARSGLHEHDRVESPPTASLDDAPAPGTPEVADPPAEAPHRRRRRRRRPSSDGD
jgi:hypothetical protein